MPKNEGECIPNESPTESIVTWQESMADASVVPLFHPDHSRALIGSACRAVASIPARYFSAHVSCCVLVRVLLPQLHWWQFHVKAAFVDFTCTHRSKPNRYHRSIARYLATIHPTNWSCDAYPRHVFVGRMCVCNCKMGKHRNAEELLRMWFFHPFVMQLCRGIGPSQPNPSSPACLATLSIYCDILVQFFMATDRFILFCFSFAICQTERNQQGRGSPHERGDCQRVPGRL